MFCFEISVIPVRMFCCWCLCFVFFLSLMYVMMCICSVWFTCTRCNKNIAIHMHFQFSLKLFWRYMYICSQKKAFFVSSLCTKVCVCYNPIINTILGIFVFDCFSPLSKLHVNKDWEVGIKSRVISLASDMSSGQTPHPFTCTYIHFGSVWYLNLYS